MNKLLFPFLTTFLICALLWQMPLPVMGQYIFHGFTASGGTPPALVSGQFCQSSYAVNPSCSLPSNDTTGNAIIVSLWSPNAIVPAVDKPSLTGATFTGVSAVTCSSGIGSYFVWIAINVTGGNKTVSSPIASVGSSVLEVSEFTNLASGVDGATVCNTGTTAAGIFTSGTSGSPSGANELALVSCRQDNTGVTLGVNSPYTIMDNPGSNDAQAYNIVSAASTATWTTTHNGDPFTSPITLFK